MKITFGDLRVGELARRYVAEALDRNWVSEGQNVAEFETRFARHFGYPYAVAVSSGTDACIVACAALHDLGAERGDEIIVPACSFVATTNAVLAAGFRPRFVDIELTSLNLDPDLVEAAITPRTRAIFAVHTMGKPCAMPRLVELADAHGLVLLEDCCEAHGARLGGRLVGSFGALGAFSFYTAHLICAGEGGMVVARDAHLASLVRSIKSHGRPDGQLYFDFQRFGTNSKMNELEAALGLEGLSEFDAVFERRRGLLRALLDLTSDLADRAHFLVEGPGEVVAPHAFPLVLRDPRWDARALYRFLEERGVQCKTLFGSLPTQHRAFAFLGHRRGDFPVAEYVGQNGLHFGCHQYLTDAHVEYAADLLHEYFRVR